MGDIDGSEIATSASDSHIEIEAVAGYFLQDGRDTDPGTFNAMSHNFGLIQQEYDTDRTLPNEGRELTQWQRFAHKLDTLNKEAPEGTTYRLLYLGRHGQGFHNIGEAFYDSDAWDCYYSLLEHDPQSPEVVFFDAHLTKIGEKQARDLSAFWLTMLEKQHMPAPQTYYTSPLTRTIQTANLTFTPLKDNLPPWAPFRPIVKELLRECHGIHSCDQRSTRTYIETTFPGLTFQEREHFSEEDELFSSTLRETSEAQSARLYALLQDVLAHDKSTYISMTAHSGTIAALLRAIGHRAFALPTGGAIPVVVKAQKLDGPGPQFDRYDKTGWESTPKCHGDPLNAGKPGYKNIGEYLKDVESTVTV